jgi:pyrroloquinoline quinone (PQQ) biosynthesis protein C
LIANCDAPPVRRRLMEHEYDELVQDEYSSKGHYDLLVRQGALIGLTAGDFAKARPLRTSLATFYGWKWITREGAWQEHRWRLEGSQNALVTNTACAHYFPHLN